MRKTGALLFCVLAGGIASAQYKTSSPKATPMPVAAAPSAEQAIASVRRISEADTNRLFKNGSAVIIDVRSTAQFALGHIKGAINIPGSQLLGRIKDLPPGKTIIAYCA